ncbi:hypothetical protein E1295_02670 [Nonomuraea mesophila]|uniref:Alkaline shock response membrane anchor protein AmaP n=1 Tax=Nonomuraea mesophila TaxID=2530382 RepID=A0A4V2ZBR6_9ACTN|nr:hypothetical protein [Nonomuraea mesophila]TDE59474.1 hypothetical protein E1295_02670 [Nonomuraea mesophila]
MSEKIGRGNRWGLALVGLVLTVLGGLALARGLGAFGPAGEPVVDGGVRDFFVRTGPWIWWVVALVALAVALVGLWWLLAQARAQPRGPLRVESGPNGVTEVAPGAMAQAVADDVASGPAVLSAHADVVDERDGPSVRLRVVADESAPLRDLSRHLSTVVLRHVRDALERDQVPAIARVSLEPSPSPHRVVR